MHHREPVTFPTPFPSKPKVNLAVAGIKMYDPNTEGDWYGWATWPEDITTTSFVAELRMIDYKITDMHATWIACVTV